MTAPEYLPGDLKREVHDAVERSGRCTRKLQASSGASPGGVPWGLQSPGPKCGAPSSLEVTGTMCSAG